LVADIEESGGRIYVLNEDDGWVAKGLELRRLSSKFESVVLHTHMDDPIPLIAFGTDDFKRPVGFFNHADHRFWLGVSVSDIVADFRTWGERITNTCRRVQDSCLLTIPADCRQVSAISKNKARKSLGISSETKVVLTVGSDFKYKPMLGIDFLNIVIPLLEANPKVVIFGIGMTFDYFPEWERVSRRFNGRLHALGYVAHDKLYDYYAASDLALDSCPTSGETAMTDAVVCRCPVLGTSNPTGLMEWFVDSVAYCHSVEELLIKAHRILTDEKYALDHVDNVVEKLVANCSEDVFRERLNDFYARLLSLPHSVKMFFSNVVGFSELDKYHLNINKKRNSHFKIGSFFEVYSERDIRGKQRILQLFGRKYSVKKSFCKW
jgi:hypothetical protein